MGYSRSTAILVLTGYDQSHNTVILALTGQGQSRHTAILVLTGQGQSRNTSILVLTGQGQYKFPNFMHSLIFTDTLFFQKFFSIQFLSFFHTKKYTIFFTLPLEFFSKFSMHLIFLIKLFFDNFLPLIFSAKSSNQKFQLNYSFYLKSFLIISFFPIRNVYLLIIYACSKNVYFQKKFHIKIFY